LGGSIDALLKPIYEDCLAGDTLIDGPDGKERIDVLAERGEPFRVWSLTPQGKRVPATASFAFRKGFAELFAYRMTDGRSITVTKDHRFLTPFGFRPASAIEVGDQIAAVDWSQAVGDEQPRAVEDVEYIGVDTPTCVVESITPAGWDYFYDMTVPGWENYSAAGLWNHNTILAWWSVKSTERAQNSGWSRYFEWFQDGANKSYTLAALMVLRAGFWSTRTVIASEMTVLDAAPFNCGYPPHGHFFLDDRIGFSMENDPTGQIWMDRARKIELKWDSDTHPEWVPTIGDPRNLQDPAQRAWGKIEQMIAALRDLGVY
jgi:hypothetical protein